MTQITEITGGATRGDTRVIGLVSAAHFVSHYYILLLPPLFPFIRDSYGVSYTELGVALAAFNVTSAVFQTPAGFLVDRIGARPVLATGLVLGAIGAAIAGLIPSFWLLVAMFALLGIGNAVYHPADYAILSQLVSAERAGHGFSIHIFAGFLGTAVAPGALLILERAVGWRGALVAAAVLGLGVAAALLMQPSRLFERPDRPAARRGADGEQAAEGWQLLLSPPILLNLAFFIMIAVSNAGVQNYSVVALAELFGTPVTIGNAALSGYLFLSAGGVLVGGLIAARTTHHGLVAAIGLVTGGLTAAVVGAIDLGAMLLILVMSMNGLVNGMIMPSRDMIVRAVTPAGSFGKVFGFVTTGFNIGGIVSPLVFGWLMDTGRPQAIFMVVAGASMLAIITIAPSLRRFRVPE